MDSLKKKNFELEAALNNQKNKNYHFEEPKNQLLEKDETIKMLNYRLNELQNQKNNLESDLSIRNNEMDLLKKRYLESNSNNHEKNVHPDQLGVYQHQISQLTNEIRALRQSQSKYEEAEKSNSILKNHENSNESGALKQVIHNLQQEIAKIQENQKIKEKAMQNHFQNEMNKVFENHANKEKSLIEECNKKILDLGNKKEHDSSTSEFKIKIAHLELQLTQSQTQKDRLNREIISLKENNERLSDEINSLQADRPDKAHHEKRSQNRFQKKENNPILEKEIEMLRSKNKALSTELAQLTTKQVTSSPEKKDIELKKALLKKKQRNKELKNTLLQMEPKIRQLIAENELLSLKLQETIGSSYVQENSKKIVDMQGIYEELIEDNKKLKKSLLEANLKIQDLDDINDQKSLRIESLENDIEDWKTEFEERIHRKRLKILQLRKSIEEAMKKIKQLLEEHESLVNENDLLPEIKFKLVSLITVLDDSWKENEDLSSKLEILMQQEADIKKQQTDHEKIFSQVKTGVTELASDLSRIQEYNAYLKAKLEKKEFKIKILKKYLNEIAPKVKDLINANSELVAQAEEDRKAYEEVLEFEDKYHKMCEKCEDLKKQIADPKQIEDLIQFKQKYHDAIKEIQDLKENMITPEKYQDALEFEKKYNLLKEETVNPQIVEEALQHQQEYIHLKEEHENLKKSMIDPTAFQEALEYKNKFQQLQIEFETYKKQISGGENELSKTITSLNDEIDYLKKTNSTIYDKIWDTLKEKKIIENTLQQKDAEISQLNISKSSIHIQSDIDQTVKWRLATLEEKVLKKKKKIKILKCLLKEIHIKVTQLVQSKDHPDVDHSRFERVSKELIEYQSKYDALLSKHENEKSDKDDLIKELRDEVIKGERELNILRSQQLRGSDGDESKLQKEYVVLAEQNARLKQEILILKENKNKSQPEESSSLSTNEHHPGKEKTKSAKAGDHERVSPGNQHQTEANQAMLRNEPAEELSSMQDNDHHPGREKTKSTKAGDHEHVNQNSQHQTQPMPRNEPVEELSFMQDNDHHSGREKTKGVKDEDQEHNKNHINQLINANKVLHQKIQELEANVQNQEQSKIIFENLEFKIKQLVMENERLGANNQILSAANENKDSKTEALLNLMNENNALKKKIEQIKDKKNKLKLLLGQQTNYIQKQEQALKNSNVADSEKKSYLMKIETLEQKCLALQQFQMENEFLKRQIDNLKNSDSSKSNNLLIEFESLKRETILIKDQLQKKTQKCHHLKEEIKALRRGNVGEKTTISDGDEKLKKAKQKILTLKNQMLTDHKLRQNAQDAIKSAFETQIIQLKEHIKELEKRVVTLVEENHRLQNIAVHKIDQVEKTLAESLMKESKTYQFESSTHAITSDESAWQIASEDFKKRFLHERQIHDAEIKHLRDINDQSKRELLRLNHLLDNKVEENLILKESLQNVEGKYKLLCEAKTASLNSDNLWENRLEIVNSHLLSTEQERNHYKDLYHQMNNELLERNKLLVVKIQELDEARDEYLKRMIKNV